MNSTVPIESSSSGDSRQWLAPLLYVSALTVVLGLLVGLVIGGVALGTYACRRWEARKRRHAEALAYALELSEHSSQTGLPGVVMEPPEEGGETEHLHDIELREI